MMATEPSAAAYQRAAMSAVIALERLARADAEAQAAA